MPVHFCTMTGRDNMGYLLKDTVKYVSPYVASIQIVDTGSTDNTKELGKLPKVKIHNIPSWSGDWVQAYMTAIKDIPNNDWFLFMDSDEVPCKLLLENLEKVVAEGNNKQANKIGLRSNQHLYDWDGKLMYTQLPGIKADPDPKTNHWRKYVLCKKTTDILAKATGGHCGYHYKAEKIVPAPGMMYYNHYKSLYTQGRSRFTHGFQYPFSFNGLKDDESVKLINEFKSKTGLKTVDNFLQYLEGEMPQTDLFAEWKKYPQGHNKNEVYDILIRHKLKRFMPGFCAGECCKY